MKEFKSKFIIKVFHPEYFENSYDKHVFIHKIGNKPYSIKFTDDIYNAKKFNTLKEAQKTIERVKKYVKQAFENGWTTYGYDYYYDENTPGHFRKVMESIEGEAKEIKLIMI